jgi:hypothetical protein
VFSQAAWEEHDLLGSLTHFNRIWSSLTIMNRRSSIAAMMVVVILMFASTSATALDFKRASSFTVSGATVSLESGYRFYQTAMQIWLVNQTLKVVNNSATQYIDFMSDLNPLLGDLDLAAVRPQARAIGGSTHRLEQ